MSATHAVPAGDNAGLRRPAFWVAVAIVVYGIGFLLWYLGTPLGKSPQLDGAENLVIAGQIANGTLPNEPFYRAMLYPAVLALFLDCGLAQTSLPQAAAVLGLLCHFASVFAVARLAGRIWEDRKRAPLIAAALWGLNPVALFYAVDVLDTTFALTLFMLGLALLARSRERMRDTFIGGVLLGLAVTARPHYMPIVVIAPLARAWLTGRRYPALNDILAWFGAMVPLIVLALLQQGASGELRVMPWQGAYNLYAANRPGANGRYYAQQLFFQTIEPGQNPARMESEAIYAQQTGATAPFSITDMNNYWREQTWLGITRRPTAWLYLMTQKVYFLFNDFEQYNNKTYVWHKERSPWLRWNFLGWGALFVVALGSLAAVWPRRPGGRSSALRVRLAGLLLVFAVYAAGVLAFYVSGRFRLPLMPLLCVAAGGWGGIWERLATGSGEIYRRLTAVVMLAAALLAFSNLFDAHSKVTFVQDESLSANAASEVGEYKAANELAESALKLQPGRSDLRRIAAISYFNLSVAGEPGADSVSGWKREMELLDGLPPDEALAVASGAALWKTGDHTGAEKAWEKYAAQFSADSAPAKALAAARMINGALQGTHPADANWVAFLKKPAAT